MSDTTDITRRLYDMANHLLRQDADLCDAAAAEITRLRAALAQAGAGPTDRELSAFAVGTESGWKRARDVERQDWNRVHHVLAKHGKHPGRTDDNLADVIDRALAAAHPAPAQREPLSDAEIAALHHSAPAGVQFLQPATVRQIARAIERAHGITTSSTKGAAS